jgi:tetratricopeptide (TPR) repeat protein
LLKDGQGALAKGELDRAKSLFVRARTSSGGDKTLFEKATLGELQVALLLKDRRLANSLLRDLEAHSASPAIVARAKELIGTQANSLKSKTSSKRKTKSNPKASCKEIALRYLNYPMEGVKALENLSRSEPRNACVQKQLGVFYARLNQPGDALAAYERYLKINPRAPDRAAVRRKTKSLKRLLGVDRK